MNCLTLRKYLKHNLTIFFMKKYFFNENQYKMNTI